MTAPDVDHIIAAHDLRRPIGRAVGSVLDGTSGNVRVTVVCHNVPVHDVAGALGARVRDDRLRLIPLADGTASPSGPFNAGLDAATARFTSIMGSDDELEPGAIDSWLAIADRHGCDIVMPRVVVVGRGAMMTPPTRPFRKARLDGVRDRLAYRSSPLGLISRAAFGEQRFPVGLRSGIDVQYGIRLWFSDARIGFDRRGPAYLVHEDAPARVSTSRKPVSGDAAFLEGMLASDAFRSLDSSARDAVVVKMLRGNVLQWIAYRPRPEMWSGDDVATLAAVIRQCADIAPRAFRPLSRTDRDILDAFTSVDVTLEEALERLPGRTAMRPRNLVPRRLSAMLEREAPLRFGVASRLVARGV